MYKYMVKIQSEEHMLYLKEIAIQYGLYTLNDNPHSQLVRVIIDEYDSIQHNTFPEIIWEGNLNRVWPHEQYDPAMKWFLNNAKRTCSSQHIGPNNKTYNFKIVEQEDAVGKVAFT